jgi:Plasmid pRiA4b ORF-3-like protein
MSRNPQSVGRRGTSSPASLAAVGRSAGKTVVVLKVTLRDIKPPIWRRLLLPATMTLVDLHEAIQAAMGWYGAHLHVFDIAGRQYGDPQILDDVASEIGLTLNSVLRSGVVRFTYTYDLGDNWEHQVLIERTQPALDAGQYPACVAGKRNCPPEDCGGPWGYTELLDAMADPAYAGHASQRAWIPEDFDPEEFDVADADMDVALRFGRK